MQQIGGSTMSRQCVLAAAVVVVVSGCGVGSELNPEGPATTATDSEALRANAFNIPKLTCRTVSVHPDATGTIQSAPQVGLLAVAPIGATVESMYFNTQTIGLETRRGIVEFSVPALDGHIASAHLSFTDQHGYAFQAVPTDVHNLEVLPGADNSITTADYGREGAPFATFSTDLNSPTVVTHTFDVTGTVALGQSTGFRIALAKLPDLSLASQGSAFVSFHLDLTMCGQADLPHGTFGGTPGVAR
jgi:hypothetical protein